MNFRLEIPNCAAEAACDGRKQALCTSDWILERLADRAAELGRLTLSRLKNERRKH